jgi:hypothetical protein
VCGPRRIMQDEIRTAFENGWSVDAIEAAVFETTIADRNAQAWLASIRRL